MNNLVIDLINKYQGEIEDKVKKEFYNERIKIIDKLLIKQEAAEKNDPSLSELIDKKIDELESLNIDVKIIIKEGRSYKWEE